MPRYYFHVRSRDGEVSRDLEGQEMSDLAAARQEAVSANREIFGERILHGGGSLDGRQIEITDEAGTVLDVVSTSDMLFQDDRFRSYDDDVTKSAPVANPIPSKALPE